MRRLRLPKLECDISWLHTVQVETKPKTISLDHGRYNVLRDNTRTACRSLFITQTGNQDVSRQDCMVAKRRIVLG